MNKVSSGKFTFLNKNFEPLLQVAVFPVLLICYVQTIAVRCRRTHARPWSIMYAMSFVATILVSQLKIKDNLKNTDRNDRNYVFCFLINLDANIDREHS